MLMSSVTLSYSGTDMGPARLQIILGPTMCFLYQDCLFGHKRYFLQGRRGVLLAFRDGEFFWTSLLVAGVFLALCCTGMSSGWIEYPLQLSHRNQSSAPRGKSHRFLWEFVTSLICSLTKCQPGCVATLNASFLHSRNGSSKINSPASVVSLQWPFQEKTVAHVAFFFLFFFC